MNLSELTGFFRSHKESKNDKVLAIELLQTMQWSKLCWDASWEEVIDLETLLPKVGQQYPIKFEENEDFGKVPVL